ncbi:hypothetical protein Tco_0392622 [Tanacetum coccineum]
MSLESFQLPVDGVVFCKPTTGITQKLPIVEGKGKGIASDEQVVQSLLELQAPKKTSTTDQYIFQRQIPVIEETSTGPSVQPEDNTSANIVCDTPSPTDAETCAETNKTNSEGDTEILNIGKKQGEDVANKVDLEEKTAEVDEGHGGSDHGKTPESRPPPEHHFKEAVQIALQAPLREHFRDLSEADMKEILHDWMFENGSYRSQPEHVALYEALEASMERDNRDYKKKKQDFDASGSKKTSAQTSSTWKTSNIRNAPSSSSQQTTATQSEQPANDILIPDVEHFSYTEDTNAAHILKIKPKPDWLKPVLEEERPETREPDWAVPPNGLPEPENN